jgi:hypothetical protein
VLTEDFFEAAECARGYDLYSNPAGQIDGMLTGRKPAAHIMTELVEGAVAVLQNPQQALASGSDRKHEADVPD